MRLDEIRYEIDRIDSEIIELLSKRGELVSAAGKLKKDEQAVRDPERVEQVINKVKQMAAKTGLDPALAEEIYRIMINCFIREELEEFKGNATSEEKSVTVYSGEQLQLKPNIPGTRMWAVGLEKAMMTYFEIEPNTIVPKHSHEAEQITMVMEGELTFVLQEKEITLKSGDVIAIPSNAIHSAFTGNKPCKAVDAWSPVRKEFL